MSNRNSKRGTATKSKAKKTASKKAPAKKKAHNYAALFAAAVKRDETSFTTSEAPNATRHGVGSHDRTTDGSISTKHKLCVSVLESLKAGRVPDVKALQKRFAPIKPGTIASWLGNWKRGIAGGAFYPSTAIDQFGGVAAVEKLFAKMQKKNG